MLVCLYGIIMCMIVYVSRACNLALCLADPLMRESVYFVQVAAAAVCKHRRILCDIRAK